MKNLRKAYNTIELIITIVLMGIIASLVSSTITDTFRNYHLSKEVSNIQMNSINTLNQLDNYFKRSINGSFISFQNNTANNADVNDSSIYTTVNRSMTVTELGNNNVLMWIDKDKENLKYGTPIDLSSPPDGTNDFIQPNYNKWINLITNSTTVANQNGFNSSANLTDFTAVQNTINSVMLQPSGVDIIPAVYFIYANQIGETYDRFWRTNTANIMTLPFTTGTKNNLPVSIFAINTDTGGSNEDITANRFFTLFEDTIDIAEVGELFELSHTAYALRLDSLTKELTLTYNFQPWSNETFRNGEEVILMDNVETFEYWVDKSLLRIKICTKSDRLLDDSDDDPLICKERSFGVI